jgi:hypothetical protein
VVLVLPVGRELSQKQVATVALESRLQLQDRLLQGLEVAAVVVMLMLAAV